MSNEPMAVDSVQEAGANQEAVADFPDWRDYLEDLRLIFSTTLFALFTAFLIAYSVLGLWELLSPLFK